MIQKVDLKGFKDYMQFTLAIFLSVFGLCCIVHLMSFLYEKHKKCQLHADNTQKQSEIIRDNIHAFDAIGNDLVYQFV